MYECSVARVEWPKIWMQFAHLIAQSRSTSHSLKVAAVIVTSDNTQVLALGYNGFATGESDVPDSLEPGQSGAIHAETNALIKCDFNTSKEKVMYVTHSPCRLCARQIVNAGIRCVVYDQLYRDPSGVELMQALGVDVLQLNDAMILMSSSKCIDNLQKQTSSVSYVKNGTAESLRRSLSSRTRCRQAKKGSCRRS